MNASSARTSSGAFQLRARVAATTGGTPGATCVASHTPAMSTRPSAITSLSAARIGPAVTSGVAIRTRRRAAPIRLAIRCESSRPRPGVNHGRTPPAGASKLPLCADRALLPQLREVARVGARRPPASSTVASTFSWRVQESSVQFVEPVHTAAPSRTTYLWCIRSRQPGIALAARRRAPRARALACSAAAARTAAGRGPACRR